MLVDPSCPPTAYLLPDRISVPLLSVGSSSNKFEELFLRSMTSVARSVHPSVAPPAIRNLPDATESEKYKLAWHAYIQLYAMYYLCTYHIHMDKECQ